MGILLKDANARYVFEDDLHSGSLAMSPEQILSKGKDIDVWAFKYFGGAPLTRAHCFRSMMATRLFIALPIRRFTKWTPVLNPILNSPVFILKSCFVSLSSFHILLITLSSRSMQRISERWEL